MRAHEQDDKAHLNKALDGMIKWEERAVELEEKVTQLQNDKNVTIFKVQRKKDSNETFYSPSFYTCPGYNIKIRVDANGDGERKGSHLSVFLCVVNGEYDDELNWPFVALYFRIFVIVSDNKPWLEYSLTL